MNYEQIDATKNSNPNSNVTFTMNLDPNAKNYSNCDINGSFYLATEKPICDISGNKVAPEKKTK